MKLNDLEVELIANEDTVKLYHKDEEVYNGHCPLTSFSEDAEAEIMDISSNDERTLVYISIYESETDERPLETCKCFDIFVCFNAEGNYEKELSTPIITGEPKDYYVLNHENCTLNHVVMCNSAETHYRWEPVVTPTDF